MKPHFLAFFIILATITAKLRAQPAQQAWWKYIQTYNELAIDQMQRYRIPASITLAQGLCESGAGQSELVRKSNNHFGIKVGMNWTGPFVIASDDRPDDKFRKYKSAAESYEDHSRFLANNPRYRSLFTLKQTDYKGWAHGLKRCGYATNPRYAEMLIGIIERYNLTQFDSKTSGRYHATPRTTVQQQSESTFFRDHIVYKNNHLYMIIARAGDTWESIADATDVAPWNLMSYNEVPVNSAIVEGQIIYLEKKRQKADRYYKHHPHVVQPGESFYTISQRYGIRLRSLYKMNHLTPDDDIQVGQILKVR